LLAEVTWALVLWRWCNYDVRFLHHGFSSLNSHRWTLHPWMMRPYGRCDHRRCVPIVCCVPSMMVAPSFNFVLLFSHFVNFFHRFMLFNRVRAAQALSNDAFLGGSGSRNTAVNVLMHVRVTTAPHWLYILCSVRWIARKKKTKKNEDVQCHGHQNHRAIMYQGRNILGTQRARDASSDFFKGHKVQECNVILPNFFPIIHILLEKFTLFIVDKVNVKALTLF
jgi:hypothetical protein